MINGGLFRAASNVLQIYSPNRPSINKIKPEEHKTTHIRDGHPAIGVPTVNHSTKTSIHIMTAKIKNRIPTIHIILMGM